MPSAFRRSHVLVRLKHLGHLELAPGEIKYPFLDLQSGLAVLFEVIEMFSGFSEDLALIVSKRPENLGIVSGLVGGAFWIVCVLVVHISRPKFPLRRRAEEHPRRRPPSSAQGSRSSRPPRNYSNLSQENGATHQRPLESVAARKRSLPNMTQACLAKLMVR